MTGEFTYPRISMKASGYKLRWICKQKGWSVLDIQTALCLGSNQAIYDWFNGKTMPTVYNLFALSKLLKVSMETLLVEEGVQEMIWNPRFVSERNTRRLLEYWKRINIVAPADRQHTYAYENRI